MNSIFAAAVADWRPGSEDHRVVARALKQEEVRFLLYATHPPEAATTVRARPSSSSRAPRRDRAGVGVARETISCFTMEADMIASRNAEVAAVAVKAVEGKPMYGGDMLVKPMMKG